MSGPDADLWPERRNLDHEWNWQSSAPCDVAALANAGADDDSLLAIASQYTVENLILNAVHEIGEWLRFDGQRLFPAHLPRTALVADGDDQGNGAVQVGLSFGPEAGLAQDAPDLGSPAEPMAWALVARLAECAASSRFTYVPGAAISFETAGTVIRGHPSCGAESLSRSSWSPRTLQAADGPVEELIVLVGRDVHRAVVFFEADRICRAFHVDGRQRWRLATPHLPLGTEPVGEYPQADLLAISIGYSNN